MAITGGQAAAVVDAGVVPVAAGGPSDRDRSGRRRTDGRPSGHADVDAGVELVAVADVPPPVPGGDRPVHRPDQAMTSGANGAGGKGSRPGAQLLGGLLRDSVGGAPRILLLVAGVSH